MNVLSEEAYKKSEVLVTMQAFFTFTKKVKK